MTSRVLAFKGTPAEFHSLAKDNDGQFVIAVQYVDADVVAQPDSGFLPIKSHVSFTSFDPSQGNLVALAYNRVDADGVVGQTTIAYDTAITSEDDMEKLVADAIVDKQEADGVVTYMVSPQVLSLLCRNASDEKLAEVLGEEAAAMVAAEEEQPNPVVLGSDKNGEFPNELVFSFVHNVSLQMFMGVASQAQTIAEGSAGNTRVISLKANDFVMGLNVESAMAALADELAKTDGVNMEHYSIMVVGFVMNGIIGAIQQNLTLTDLLILVQQKMSAAQAQQGSDVSNDEPSEEGDAVEQTEEPNQPLDEANEG